VVNTSDATSLLGIDQEQSIPKPFSSAMRNLARIAGRESESSGDLVVGEPMRIAQNEHLLLNERENGEKLTERALLKDEIFRIDPVRERRRGERNGGKAIGLSERSCADSCCNDDEPGGGLANPGDIGIEESGECFLDCVLDLGIRTAREVPSTDGDDEFPLITNDGATTIRLRSAPGERVHPFMSRLRAFVCKEW
jgi:hypothetical protein